MRPIRLAFALALLAAIPLPAAADEWNHTFNTGSHPVLQVTADDGSVHVLTWDRPEIQVHVETEGWRIRPGQVTIVPEQQGEHLRLAVHAPHLRWDFDLRPRRIRIEIHQPAHATLDIRTGDGGVRVAGVSGAVSVQTGDGSIWVEGIRGAIDLRSGDGRIEGTRLDGSLQVTTGDGSIDVHGRFDGLELESGDGPIEAGVQPGSTLVGAWQMRSGDGSIHLQLPPTLDAMIDADTGDGSVRVALPIQLVESRGRTHVRGRLNAGGPTVRVHTGDGSIHITASLVR